MAKITLQPHELAYLIRSVERDLDDYEAACWVSEPEEYASNEVALGDMVLRLLRRAEQDQVITH